MNKISQEVQAVKNSIRCGYPDVGTKQKSSVGLKLYTKNGLFFSSNENIKELAEKKGIEGI